MSFCSQTIHGLVCCWLYKVGVHRPGTWFSLGFICIPTHHTASYSGGHVVGWQEMHMEWNKLTKLSGEATNEIFTFLKINKNSTSSKHTNRLEERLVTKQFKREYTLFFSLQGNGLGVLYTFSILKRTYSSNQIKLNSKEITCGTVGFSVFFSND